MIPRRYGWTLATAALVLLAAAAAACDDGGGNPASSPTPAVASTTPGPTATSTPLPPDPTMAANLRYHGEHEAAAEVYAAIAAQSDGATRQAALLAQGQSLLKAGSPEAAEFALDAYMRLGGPAAEGADGQYLLASVYQDLGKHDLALDLYSRYAITAAVLTPYAHIERAKLLAGLGRAAEAEAVAAGAIADPVVEDRVPSFTLSMARAYSAAALTADALAWFTRAQAYEDVASFAYVGAGDLRLAAGDPAWSGDYLAALAAAPGGPDAMLVLDALTAAGVPVGDWLRGFAEYRAGRNDAARASLERAVAAGDRPGEALYYLGALDERAGDDAAAIVHYQQSYDSDPASAQADSALWWRGRLLENASRYDEALGVYTLLAEEFPASDWADGAAFRRGLAQYKAGRAGEAAATWAALAGRDGAEGFRARLWQGKALIESGDAAQGEAVLRGLRDDEDARGDYYALRAAELLGEGEGPADDGDPALAPLSPDWDAIAGAIAPPPKATASPGATPSPTPPPVDLAADERWARADALDAAGLGGLADSLRSEILSGISDERTGLAVTRRFFEAGDESYAARAAATLLSVLPPDVTPPEDLRRLAYPPAFSGLVTRAADEQGIDPLLLLALMRQESLYDPEAGSVAGALGLIQIIPSTGHAIAAELGESEFVTEDLFRPAVNVRFGAHFLASQLDAFDGNIRHAAAAYNGGPGAAIDARDLAGDDADLFVEELEFEETRLYVRRVLEHYAQYRDLYAP